MLQPFGSSAFRLLIFFTFFMIFDLKLSLSKDQAEFSDELSGLDLVAGKDLTIQLSKAKHGTVIIFLSSKCPCSNSHLSALNQLAKKFNDDGFSFVGVHSNVNEDYNESRQYFQSSKLSFPVIQDVNAKIADTYEAFKTPHVFVVSPQRKMLYQGGVDDSKVMQKAKRQYLLEALLAIRNGKEPAEKNVRVLGCEIKRP